MSTTSKDDLKTASENDTIKDLEVRFPFGTQVTVPSCGVVGKVATVGLLYFGGIIREIVGIEVGPGLDGIDTFYSADVEVA